MQNDLAICTKIYGHDMIWFCGFCAQPADRSDGLSTEKRKFTFSLSICNQFVCPNWSTASRHKGWAYSLGYIIDAKPVATTTTTTTALTAAAKRREKKKIHSFQPHWALSLIMKFSDLITHTQTDTSIDIFRLLYSLYWTDVYHGSYWSRK